jgi:hypothetical protein
MNLTGDKIGPQPSQIELKPTVMMQEDLELGHRTNLSKWGSMTESSPDRSNNRQNVFLLFLPY